MYDGIKYLHCKCSESCPAHKSGTVLSKNTPEAEALATADPLPLESIPFTVQSSNISRDFLPSHSLCSNNVVFSTKGEKSLMILPLKSAPNFFGTGKIHESLKEAGAFL